MYFDHSQSYCFNIKMYVLIIIMNRIVYLNANRTFFRGYKMCTGVCVMAPRILYLRVTNDNVRLTSQTKNRTTKEK